MSDQRFIYTHDGRWARIIRENWRTEGCTQFIVNMFESNADGVYNWKHDEVSIDVPDVKSEFVAPDIAAIGLFQKTSSGYIIADETDDEDYEPESEPETEDQISIASEDELEP